MDWSIGNILWIIIGGAIIGIIARLLLRGRQNIPFWAVIIAGIIGMFVGDWLSSLFGVKETRGFDWIRHGLQLVVGVGAVAVLSAAFGRGKAASGGSHTGTPTAVSAPASNVAPTAPAAVAGTAAAAGAAVAGAASSAGDAVSGAASAAGDAVSDVAQGAGQSAAAAVESVAGDAASGVADAAGQATGAVGDAAGSVGDAASGAVGQATDAVTDAAKALGDKLPGQ